METMEELLTTTRVVRRRLDLSWSVEPAVLERCNALRPHGIGCAWTTNHLMYEHEAAEVLGCRTTW